MGRALAKLPMALELLLPLVQVGGVAAVFAGPGAARWLPDAARIAVALGAEPPIGRRRCRGRARRCASRS